MKKFLAILLSLLMLLALISGCGNEPEAVESESKEESKTESEEESKEEEIENRADGAQVAICIGSINHPVHRIVQMCFLNKAEALGMEGIVSGLDEGSTQELISKWESAVTNGATGTLVWTGDDVAYSMMRDFKDMGVAVVVPHFAHDYYETRNFIDRNITSSAAEYGKAAADFVLEKLEEKGITSGSVVVTQSSANVTENAANDAFCTEISANAPQFTILNTVFEGGEVTEATNKCTAIISANADLVAAFGTTGGSAQAWNAAITNTGKTNLVVVGVDYTEFNLNTVKEGNISAIVCQPLKEEAELAAESIYDILSGKTFTDSEDDWFVVLDAPLAYLGGEGASDISVYEKIVEQVKEYYS